MLTTKGTALAQLAKNNRALVETLSKDQDELRDKTDAELRRLQYDVYQPKIHALNEECQALLNKVKEAAVKVHNLKVEQIKDLMAPVNQVERILEFFRSDTKQDLKTTDEIVSYPDRYKDRYRENLGVVFSDQYLEVRLFILQNDKPTNKYFLALIGKCLFDNGLGERPLLKLPRHYAVGNAQWGTAPQEVLKEAANVKDLHTWWLAHGFSKVAWLTDYLKVEAEYEHILKTYTLADFQDFITWFCPTCGYFNTVFESFRLWGDEKMTCPRDKTVMLPKEALWPVPKK
jgi:archaellum component FlaC